MKIISFLPFKIFHCQYLTLLLRVRRKKCSLYTTKQANEKLPEHYFFFLIQNIAMKYLSHNFYFSQSNIISLSQCQILYFFFFMMDLFYVHYYVKATKMKTCTKKH